MTRASTTKQGYVLQITILLALWSVFSFAIQQWVPRGEVFVPTPWDVVGAIPGLAAFAGGAGESWSAGVLVIIQQSAASVIRLALGLIAGLAVGIGLGLLLSANSKVRAMAEGPLLAIRTVPLFALIPLFLVWFGGSPTGAVAFIAFAVFAMILVSTVEAVNNVPAVLQRYARTMGASRRHIYRTVILPAVVPELTGAIRIVIAFSWALLLAAEYLAAQSGLGRILILAQQYSLIDRMALVVVLIIIYTVVVDWAFARVASRMTAWMPR